MNRQERRKYIRELRKFGISGKQIEDILFLKEASENVCLQEGQKVKLNLEKIKSNVNYENMSDKYKKFIELHKDDIFTVEYDKNHMNNPVVVCFKEDTTDPKWLFWDGDLEVIKQ
ncbi:hypothetical protein [Anaerovorax sp. IOR16]|uniref:hypothetical protein n=1 Tax=Anaerovorax sp. IOR16 TaxID=2773458 RepID=UPI0019D03494|nr:hypothetical protein [Anaerovorax sp. IOR16]